MKSALLIIDVQTALCSGEYKAFNASRVINRINDVSSKARRAGVTVVVVQHESEDAPFVFESAGWQLAEGLNVEANDLRVRKRATDSFHNTELQETLVRHSIDHLVVCGMQSEFCVDTTIRRALALGYPVTLVSDAHSTIDNGVLKAAQITEHHNVTLANITSYGPRVHPVPAGELEFDSVEKAD